MASVIHMLATVRSVEVCGNDVTVWTLHMLRIGAIGNLIPSYPTQTMQRSMRQYGFELAYFIPLSPSSLKQVYCCLINIHIFPCSSNNKACNKTVLANKHKRI